MIANYRVVMQTREYNSLGSYGTSTVNVAASCISDAVTDAINELGEQSLECGFPVRVVRTSMLDAN